MRPIRSCACRVACRLTVPLLMWLAAGAVAHAVILWSDPDARVIHHTPDGIDILAGAVKRDDTANDALYFRFHVVPLSDVATEEYYAVFQLFEGEERRLALGNAPEAWGYSASYASETGPSNRVAGEFDLKSARPEAAGLGHYKPYELPRQNTERTIVFKVQYVPGGDDLITVWLSPHLGPGDNDENQPELLTTKFKANASFDQLRLRHDGGGNGWIFGQMAIATSFRDFVIVRFWQTRWFIGSVAIGLLAVVGVSARLVEKRRYLNRLRHLEQERALQRERARIAQDLHDDLGSSLTRISLLTDLVKADKHNPDTVEIHADKISHSAYQAVRALEEIVWAVRPRSDTLQSLVEYIAHFANELFENNGVACRLDLPHDLPTRSLPPELRHNIFLVIKEALTNSLKHASATEVRIRAQATENILDVVVEDNGRGFDPSLLPADNRGNGLGNMRRRAETIGGVMELTSRPGAGTTVRLSVRLSRGGGESQA